MSRGKTGAFYIVLSGQDKKPAVSSTFCPHSSCPQATAQKIAEFLSSHPRVERVFYAGLPDHPGRELHFSQVHCGCWHLLALGAGTVPCVLLHIAQT